MSMFRSLRDVSLQDVAEVGGKAARLAEAMRLGCPVLPGVVLCVEAYRRYMLQGGLQGEIGTILATMQPRAWAHFQAAEWAIHEAFKVRRVPDDVSEAITAAWRSIGEVPAAVRSSATNEDSPEQSFVGLHDTILGVDTEEAAIEAVLVAWASLYSAKALAYAQTFGVDLLSSSMAILFQPMTTPITRGALFTVDPILGDADVFVLETRERSGTGIQRLDPYSRRPGEHAVWSQLRHLGLLLDESLHAYQSIEWSVAEDGQLYFFRVRPATGVPAYLPEAQVHVTGGGGALELVSEPSESPRALRPYSWYHRSRSPRLKAARFSRIDRLFGQTGAGERVYPNGYQYVRRRSTPAPQFERLGLLARWVYSLRRINAARSMDREFVALWESKRERLDELNCADISALSYGQLGDHLREAMALHEAFWAESGRLEHVGDVLMRILCFLHSRWIGEDADQCGALARSIDDLAVQADALLCDLAREDMDPDDREAAFLSFFRRHRHLYLSGDPVAPWQDICALREEPDRARARMERWREGDGLALSEQHQESHRERAERVRTVLGQLGLLRRALYGSVLNLATHYAPLERDRDEPVRLCRLMERDVVFEVGRRLVLEGLGSAPEDACLLSSQHIIDWLAGRLPRDELVRTILEHKDLGRRWSRYTPPRTLSAAASLARPVLEPDGMTAAVLHGRPVSPGSATGRARVVATLGEATNLLPGEVLVCQEASFELSALYSLASAVVAQEGGLLDHTSVLTREYGVPAVFSVPDAMTRIRTGQQIEVDAYQGLVVIHGGERRGNAIEGLDT